MKTLYESILDADFADKTSDQAIEGLYKSAFYDKDKVKYNAKTNTITSKACTLNILYEDGSISVVEWVKDRLCYIKWEDYDINHAKFKCPLQISYDALANGFKMSMIDWDGPILRIDCHKKTQVTVLNTLLDKPLPKNIELYFNGHPTQEDVSNPLLKNINCFTVYDIWPTTATFSTGHELLSYTNMTAPKYYIEAGKHVFGEVPNKFNSCMKNVLYWEQSYESYKSYGSFNKNLDKPSTRIRNFIKNNPNTTLYISMGATIDKCELDPDGDIKITNMSKSKMLKE